jgi:hypothetical protein
MVTMKFQTNSKVVIIRVESDLDMREIYNAVCEQTNDHAIAAECVELAMNGDYLEE